jgi:bifunctional oligoribonuclease and PAP phosphatase NrnA
MTKTEISKVKALLDTPKSVVIIPHINPDGDAIGSTLGLYHFLRLKNHNAIVISPNDFPDFFKWMPGQDEILIHQYQPTKARELIEKAQLIFTLDFNNLKRIGEMGDLVSQSSGTKILIDHHQQPDDYAQIQYSDVNMSSTCEMVYHFIDFLGETQLINTNIASCLYTGIMTDTGSFRYRSTTSKTHYIISKLIEQGADNTYIHNQVYDSSSVDRLKLLGVALNNLVYLKEYSTVYISLSQNDLDKNNFKKGDSEGFVNYGLSIKGVKFAVLFIEKKDENLIKISFRSKGDFSVNTFARTYFEGGGHNNAAGGKSDLSLEATIDKFISILPNYSRVLN